MGEDITTLNVTADQLAQINSEFELWTPYEILAGTYPGQSEPMTPRDIMDAMVQGTRNVISTAILLITVGVIVNVVSTTGIGNTFSLMVTEWAGGSLLITIVLVALASLILGMGLPVTAAYIVLATLSAPAIYNLIAQSQWLDLIVSGNLPDQAKTIFMLAAPDQLAALEAPMEMAKAQQLLALVPESYSSQLLEQALSPHAISMALVAAHMIIFWLSQDSNVTPPVCLTAFAAAAIAGTPQMRTGFTAWKIAKGLYIVPLLFAYSPLISGLLDVTGLILFLAILVWSSRKSSAAGAGKPSIQF